MLSYSIDLQNANLQYSESKSAPNTLFWQYFVCVGVSIGYSGFLPHSKVMPVSLTGESKLPLIVLLLLPLTKALASELELVPGRRNVTAY